MRRIRSWNGSSDFLAADHSFLHILRLPNVIPGTVNCKADLHSKSNQVGDTGNALKVMHISAGTQPPSLLRQDSAAGEQE